MTALMICNFCDTASPANDSPIASALSIEFIAAFQTKNKSKPFCQITILQRQYICTRYTGFHKPVCTVQNPVLQSSPYRIDRIFLLKYRLRLPYQIYAAPSHNIHHALLNRGQTLRKEDLIRLSSIGGCVH